MKIRNGLIREWRGVKVLKWEEEAILPSSPKICCILIGRAENRDHVTGWWCHYESGKPSVVGDSPWQTHRRRGGRRVGADPYTPSPYTYPPTLHPHTYPPIHPPPPTHLPNHPTHPYIYPPPTHLPTPTTLPTHPYNYPPTPRPTHSTPYTYTSSPTPTQTPLHLPSS